MCAGFAAHLNSAMIFAKYFGDIAFQGRLFVPPVCVAIADRGYWESRGGFALTDGSQEGGLSPDRISRTTH